MVSLSREPTAQKARASNSRRKDPAQRGPKQERWQPRTLCGNEQRPEAGARALPAHTIANLVCHLLATAGKRVLITAETGRALEVPKNKLPADPAPLRKRAGPGR